MANDDHIAWLRKGVAAWNDWRKENPGIRPDFIRADLHGADLNDADLSGADFTGAHLSMAHLNDADLSGANLSRADLVETGLIRANLSGANLGGANLHAALLNAAYLVGANLYDAFLNVALLYEANLNAANLSGANLVGATLYGADLSGADLSGADLSGADLRSAKLHGANLSGADLDSATLVNTNLTGANLAGCRIYGVSAWDLELENTNQQNLIITPKGEPTITVDNIEVAQFIYLLLHNEKIRYVIDTIGRKGVLLLGRFTEGRMVVLERLREKLRSLGYVPIVFNFDKPETKDFTETVQLLANLSHFVIVDISNPRSSPLELQASVPDYMVPFVPILDQREDPFAMFVNLQNKYDWVLKPVISYSSADRLIEVLEDEIVRPAEKKFNELLARRTEKLVVKNI
jgi:uncharacterized protein YjbI with pentapeptide repeats